jgi:hypothetical protein
MDTWKNNNYIKRRSIETGNFMNFETAHHKRMQSDQPLAPLVLTS